MIRRFLRARDMDIEKASTLFLKYLAWKKSVLPKGHIPESEIANDLSHNKVCMQGHDKMGRPIVVSFGNRHNPSKGNPDEFKRELLTFKHQNLSLHINHPYLTYFFLLTCPAGFVVYTLEKICARFVIIIIIQSFQVVSY